MLRRMINRLGVTIGLGCIVAIGTTAAWSNIVVPTRQAYATKAAFDQAFNDVAAVRADNSATTREKLRDLGWKHLKVALASK
jgi:hypothetical protein